MIHTDQKTNVYALINPINNHIFYVGCSHIVETRLAGHISSSKKGNTSKDFIIRQIISSGYKPELLYLETCTVGTGSFWEEFYIELFTSFGFRLYQNRKSCYTEMYRYQLFNINDKR